MKLIHAAVLAVTIALTPACLTQPDDVSDDLGSASSEGRVREQRVKVCHLPPSNPSAAQTIEVLESQVAGHLAHGDTRGQCVCPPGEVWVCYTADYSTDMVGACERGTKTCAADGMSYGPCIGEITPVPEVCGDNIDNDCNGEKDEECTGCVPSAEVCGDSLDNDCDGIVDDGCVCAPGATTACYDGPGGTAGVGTCAAGTMTCAADGMSYGACTGAVEPTADLCGDGLDNDCDGVVDDGCVCAPGATAACYDGPAGTEGVGVCAAGTMTCVADGSGYGACGGSVGPSAETCGDGLDNDCDGTVDEGCVCTPGTAAACYDGPAGTDGVGTCAPGSMSCNGTGTSYGACTGSIGPVADLCGDGLDNNCDGVVDETCVCAPSSTSACYTGPAGTAGVGTCHAGVRTCDAAGSGYGACIGEVRPGGEVCGDGLDNDCDGQVDENCVGDRVWLDRNGNGVQDAGEVGLGGATMILRTSSGAVVAVAVSAATGDYWFSGVPAGSYYVEVIPPFMYVLTVANAGGNDSLDSDFDDETYSSSIFTTTGATFSTLDGGFYLNAGS